MGFIMAIVGIIISDQIVWGSVLTRVLEPALPLPMFLGRVPSGALMIVAAGAWLRHDFQVTETVRLCRSLLATSRLSSR